MPDVSVETNAGAQSILQLQNTSNPFSNSTHISYSIPQKTQIQLKVFDTSGKQI
ncbi:MAG: hypothetical protein WCH34_02220 [Bacteroidota bacterium]